MKLSNAQQRKAGVLCHISSLPNSVPVDPLANTSSATGDLGLSAYRFVDFLNHIGASVWQTLPINMPHADNSPYQCVSAFAGNHQFISLEKLIEQGLLTSADLTIDASQNRPALFKKAYANYQQSGSEALKIAYPSFCRKNSHWLNDYALFCILREQHGFACWNAWPKKYRDRDKTALDTFKKVNHDALAIVKFTQFCFFEQWHALKSYANQHGVAIFGDIPIFVAYDSADVWAHSELFKLNKHKQMTVVAGVPPDYFSATGQRWGNPHYDWVKMRATSFKWWVQRMATQNALFDLVRIDHFRGLEAAWEIPADEPTAMNGTWVTAPGDALLRKLTNSFPDSVLIAEDLGVITPAVTDLKDKFALPGMKILHFAFGGQDDNPYLPQHITPNSVAYTGTHDNDTSLGWYLAMPQHEKNYLHGYLQTDTPNMPYALNQLALNTNANLVIIPMQDILGLDSTHRMNTPGTCDGNWHWRFDWAQLQPVHSRQIAEAIAASGRVVQH